MAEQAKRFYPKKLTTKMAGLDTVKLQQIAEENKDSGSIPVLRLAGRVSKTEACVGTFGPYSRYNGEFEAHNLIDNTIHRSKTLLMPSVAETIIDECVAVAKADNPNAVADVLLDINVSYYDNPNPTGTRFIFGASPLLEPKGNDSLSQLAALAGPPPLLGIAAPVAKKNGKK